MQHNSQYTNIAFISYKREDEKWAKWLQKKLEHYKLPTEIRKQNPDLDFAKNPRHVFKDTSDLSGGVLAKAIKEGLDSSKFLIVICSPRAAKSEWVCKEVQDFIDSGREEYIIPFIIDGEPYAKHSENECFPAALKTLSGERELLGININENGRDMATVKVVARMFDIHFDTLWDRFKREERERQLYYLFTAVIFASVLIFSYNLYLQKQISLQELKLSETKVQQLAKEKKFLNKEASIIKHTNQIVRANFYNSEGYSISAIHELLPLINSKDKVTETLKQEIEKTIITSLNKLINNKLSLISIKKKERNTNQVGNCIIQDLMIEEPDFLFLTFKKKYDLHSAVKTWRYSKLFFVVLEGENDDLLLIFSLDEMKLIRKIKVPWSWFNNLRGLTYNESNSTFEYHYGFRGDEGIIEFSMNNLDNPRLLERTETSNGGSRIISSPSHKYYIKCQEQETANGNNNFYTLHSYKNNSTLLQFDLVLPSESIEYRWEKDINQDFIVLSYDGYDYYFIFKEDKNTQVNPHFSVRDMCISNNGQYIAYTTNNDMLYIYDCVNKSYLQSKYIVEAKSINFSQSSLQIGIIDQFGSTVSIYNVSPFTKSKEFNTNTSYNTCVDVSFSFCGNDNYIITHHWYSGINIYKISTGERIYSTSNKNVLYNTSMDTIVFESDDNQKAYFFGPDSIESIPIINNKIKYFSHTNYDSFNSFKATSDNDDFFVELYRGKYIRYGRTPSIKLFDEMFKDMLKNK